MSSVPPPPPPPGDGGYVIAFSTFLGGGDIEEIREPRLLPDGRLLIGARSRSANMPVTPGAFQPNYGGGIGDTWLGILREDGSALDAATYFGGSGMERPAYGLEVLPSGDIVFTSGTTSPNIPTTPESFVPDRVTPAPAPGDGYVCRISGDLTTLRWCTYTGGGWPRGGLAVDADERLWVVGRALSDGFFTTPDAIQSTPRGEDDAFILLLSADGRQAVYSTRLGGGGSDVGEVVTSVLVDDAGTVWATGNSRSIDFPTAGSVAQPTSTGVADAFALSLDASRKLRFTTLIGGDRDDFTEHRTFLLPDGSPLIAGGTWSALPNIPGSGFRRSYLAVVTPDGSGISYMAPPAADLMEHLLGPEVDAAGRVYLFGRTDSPDLPVTDNAIQSTYAGDGDGFLMVLAPDFRTIEYATYLGGSGFELIRGAALTSDGRIFLVGRTASDDFPVVSALQPRRGGSDDGFVIRLDPR
ncbi:MAG: hypothetical protein R3195_05020 [Gemmatimonadota bacterium]|nr:hypothetical protein [Gemmatimonadota bacterium]